MRLDGYARLVQQTILRHQVRGPRGARGLGAAGRACRPGQAEVTGRGGRGPCACPLRRTR